MEIFLHVVALAQLGRSLSVVIDRIGESGTFAEIVRPLYSIDELSLIGTSALVLVVVADSLSIYRLWQPEAAWTDTDATDSAAELRDVVGPRDDSSTENLEQVRMRRALWAILGLASLAIGGMIVAFADSLGDMLRSWPRQATLGAVIIGVALVLSAAVLSSFWILAARINAVAAISDDVAEAVQAVARAERKLAVLSAIRASAESAG